MPTSTNAFLLFALVFGVAFAAFTGGDWRAAALGGFFGLVLAALNRFAPLLDWAFPKGDKGVNDD